MKKIFSLVLISLFFSSCAYVRPHKIDIEQGNTITQKELKRIHVGMSEKDIKHILGSPMLVNIFSDKRVDYIYTFQTGYEKRLQKRITLVFEHGRLKAIQKI